MILNFRMILESSSRFRRVWNGSAGVCGEEMENRLNRRNYRDGSDIHAQYSVHSGGECRLSHYHTSSIRLDLVQTHSSHRQFEDFQRKDRQQLGLPDCERQRCKTLKS